MRSLLTAAERSACEKKYSDFLRCAWWICEPDTDLVWNWHLDYLCDLLQGEIERIAAGKPKTRDIIINISPRSLKSYTTTVFLNAWTWTRWPQLRFITSSYSAELANQHAMKTRKVVESDWYRSHWPVELSKDQNRVSIFENVRGGFRKAVGVGGTVTGMGGDVIITDDPVNPLQAFSEPMLRRARDWWDLTFQNRLNDHHTGLRIIVMQRLHEEDPTGHVLNKNPLAWNHIRIPGELGYPVEPESLAENYEDGLFFPSRFNKLDLIDFKTTYGGIGYANQIGQSPAPADGAIFKKDWFNRFTTLPPIIKRYTMTCDLTFKGSTGGRDDKGIAFVALQVWATDGIDHYLADQTRRKMTFTETRAAILALRERWPQVYTILIEDKANGPAIMDDLRREVGGMVAVSKGAGKEENANAASPVFEAGHVFIPEGSMGDEFIAEHLSFPRGRYKDQVDACAQYIIREKKSYANTPIRVLPKLRGERTMSGLREMKF